MLEQMNTTLININAKMEQDVKDTQQIHANQTQMGGRMEEKNKNSGGELKKSIDSSTRQGGKEVGRCLYDQAMVSRNSNVGGS